MTWRRRGAVAVLAGCCWALAAADVAAADDRPWPSFAEVRDAHRPSDLVVLDRHGDPLQTLRVDHSVRRLDWVPLEDVSPALLQALLHSEDRRFWEHAGVDWRSLAASAWRNAWNTRTRGASTLTMQLAGLVDVDLQRPAAGRSLAQKAQQAWGAVQLERRWSKAQILEAYLNLVPWRGELVGIGALSQTLFGKFAHGLDAQEAAIAAVLVRGPNADAPLVARRACALLQSMGERCDGLAPLAERALAQRGGMPLGPQVAPHAARQLRALAEARIAAGERRFTTSLDADVQRLARAVLRQQLAELAGHEVGDGAVVVLDNETGGVLAWVGSAGDLASSQVDGVLARRQPGSTLKPFVYGLAFERRLLTAATLLADEPTQIPTAAGLYLPQNYERDFKGWVSARTALAASLNVPAVRVGELVGVEALHARLDALGLGLEEPPGHYGASLALGSADVSLLSLTNAYRTLARRGRWSAAVLGPDAAPAAGATTPGPARVVMPAAVAALLTDILADPAARAATFGLDSVLATRGFAAVKTGTSKDLRDNWCVGFTDRFTVGVWVGNASGEPMQRVAGTSGAAPVWAAIVGALHADSPSRRPPPPAGLVRAPVAFDARAAAHDAARSEWFLAGTQPRAGQASAPAVAPVAGRWQRIGITQPRDGSVFALDPDIPLERQRLRFAGERGRWVLNGRPLGEAQRIDWLPRPGRHELRLVDAAGRTVQAVRFEVRAAAVRPAPPPGGRRAQRALSPNSRSSAESMTSPQAL